MKTLKIITAATTEPLSLAEAKNHLRVLTNDEDALISVLITAARQWCENFTGRALASQIFEYILDDFPEEDEKIILPMPPLETVDSIKYKDFEETETEWNAVNYIVDDESIPARIALAYGKYFPSYTPYPVNSVRIRFTAGYKEGGDPHLEMPEQINSAIKLLIGHLFENRENVVIGSAANKVPFTVEALLYPYKVNW